MSDGTDAVDSNGGSIGEPSQPSPVQGMAPELKSPSPAKVKTLVAGRALLLDLLLIALWVVVSDFLIYRNGSFASWGLFLAWSAMFFAFTRFSIKHLRGAASAGWSSWLFGSLLFILAAKLLWCGSWLQVVCGTGLVLCYAMSLAGRPPFLPEMLAALLSIVSGAGERLVCFRFGTFNAATGAVRPLFGAALLLPVAISLLFGGLFTLANPSLAQSLSESFASIGRWGERVLSHLGIGDFLFWFVSAWLMLGMLYPTGKWLMREIVPQQLSEDKIESTLYIAYRNTLLTVSCLFSAYLAFEFLTLWRRDFPDDFYYAGYAHQGAFWLTVALAFSTLMLSVIFSGKTLCDPRLQMLKKYAVVWSVLNLLLSVAVYNRLFIYIDFNGLTRMRVVGILGTTSVLLGFILVVIKVLRDRGIVWLLHRQLWVPFAAVVMYAMIPVDFLVQSYNVRQFATGNSAPIVQVIAHLTKSEGTLPLFQLVDHEDALVRDGVRALLALWALELEVEGTRFEAALPQGAQVWSPGSERRSAWRFSSGHASPWVGIEPGFSTPQRRPRKSEGEPLSVGRLDADGNAKAGPNALDFQIADGVLLQRLAESRELWEPFAMSHDLRERALIEFFDYSYQWY